MTEALEFSALGPTAMVVGGPSVLSKAAMGLVPIRNGALRVRGWAPTEGVQRGLLAGVLRDWVVPCNWTLRRALVECARLSGLPLADAQDRAKQCAETMLLVPLLDRSFGAAPLAVRRAASLASALVTRAQVLMLEDLFEGLTFAEKQNFGEVAKRAIGDREWICFCSHFDEAHPFASLANEKVVLSPGKPARVEVVITELAPVSAALA